MDGTQLTDLPNELLFRVFEFVACGSTPSKRDLCSLALTSVRFRAIAERLVYQSFAAQNEEMPELPAVGRDTFSRFLGSIIGRRDLGLCLKSFHAERDHHFSDVLTKTQKSCLSAAMRSALNLQASAAVEPVGSSPLEAGLGLLLLLAPNLESFSRHMVTHPPKWGNFLFTDVFKLAQPSESHASTPFANLRRISLGFQRWPTPCQLSAVRSLLPLPALREISLSGIHWRQSGRWLKNCVRSSGVISLRITDSEVNVPMLRSLLPCFRGLKSFTYKDSFVILNSDTLAEIVLELARYQCSTLETLVVDPRAGSFSRATKISSLERFALLREVTLPSSGVVSAASCGYGPVS